MTRPRAAQYITGAQKKYFRNSSLLPGMLMQSFSIKTLQNLYLYIGPQIFQLEHLKAVFPLSFQKCYTKTPFRLTRGYHGKTLVMRQTLYATIEIP